VIGRGLFATLAVAMMLAGVVSVPRPARADFSQPTATPRPTPRPTPNPWRNLPLATATLDEAPQGDISVIGGFAAAKRDGTAAIACVSFKNLATKRASRVVFEIPLFDANNQRLGKLTIDRKGEFSPNIDIMSYAGMNDWQNNSMGPRSRMDNCTLRQLATAAMPILEARVASYGVVRVEYDDGTSWTPSP